MEPEIPYPQTLKSEEQEKGEEKENDEDEEYEKLLEMLMKITPPSNIEEEKRKRQEELDLKIAQAFQEFWEKEDISYQKRMEQESRDHELALLLSQQHCDCKEVMDRDMKRDQGDYEPALKMELENQDYVKDINNIEKRSACTEVKNPMPDTFNRSPLVRSIQEEQGKQKYDLTKWKYSEIRDTINTSSDIELLEACKIEFHRRLKVYHAWKAKNRKRDDNQRAPSSILEEGNKPKHIPLKMPINNVTQRYFRIPIFLFSRPTENQAARGQQQGWWYAHFDGQYVARQMELHPEKPAILLTAGSDDMQMCELSLDETGLTRKRGAEILEEEFNHEWKKYAGKTYINPCEESCT